MWGPETFYGKREKVCDICIITFSYVAMQWALEHFKCQQIDVIESDTIGSVNGNRPIYLVDLEGCKVAFYMTMVSAPAAAGCIEEARHMTGASHYIMFGSCGSLDGQKTEGKIIVPTHAYRDEGLSYHYLEPAESIVLENAGKVAAFLEENDIPYVLGKTWTTDALYRETKNKVDYFRKEGCLAVEMECSAVQAVCRFYGLQFYNFLFAGDFFGEEGWNAGDLGGERELDFHVRCFGLALKLAQKLNAEE